MGNNLTDEQLDRWGKTGVPAISVPLLLAHALALRAERANPTPSDEERARKVVHDLCGDTCQFMDGCGCYNNILSAFASIRAEGSAERAKLGPLDDGRPNYLGRLIGQARAQAHPELDNCTYPSRVAAQAMRDLVGQLADALSEKCDNLRTLPDPHGVCAIKVELRQSVEDFSNSQTPVGMLCISPDDLTKLLNDHDALAECVWHLMQGTKP